ncbi:MAG: YcaO-like family protein [Gammaproteobacteria bacterium]|nr:YcaO-like family protein [Gammaproteobacteria bacterium]
MSKTYIAGKDAALEDSIEKLQLALSSRGFNIIEHTWANPAPNVWWVHIRDDDAPMCFTNGKGATKKAALASALGEYIERLSCNYFFADFHLGDTIARDDFVHYPNEKWFTADSRRLIDTLEDGVLDNHLVAHYDPENELTMADLVDINSGNRDRGVCALPFIRQSDQKTVHIPMNIIGNLYVSNGMSAGNSESEARTQALSEVFERYVKNKIIAEGIALPLIPDDVLARHPNTVAAIEALQSEGYVIHAFDASLGGQFPVICVTLLNRENGGCFASFGAHPSFTVALERTVTELLQGRSIKEMDIFSAPSFDNELVSDTHNLETHFIDSSGLVSWDLYRNKKDYNFVDWDFSDSSSNEFEFLMGIFKTLGAEVYIADYHHVGAYACRVIVPSISEIYPAEELIQYNNNVGVAIRDMVKNMPNLTANNTDKLEELLHWLEDAALDDSELVRQVLGFTPEANSAWNSLRLGELRCLVLLALQDYEEALDMAEWVITFGASTLSHSRQRFYACVIEQLQLVLDDSRDAKDYEWIHREVYGSDIYDAACNHVTGSDTFYDLTVLDGDYSSSVSHTQLLSAYDKLQTSKRLAYTSTN